MEKIRDLRFDVLKGALILSVVFGHFFTHDVSHSFMSETMANIIYSFHMPLFVFISGYFTKKYSVVRGASKILETYVVFQLVKGLAYHYSPLWLLIMPAPMLWYLLSLIVWRFLYILLDKIGVKVTWKLIAILVTLGVSVGFVPWVGREFALSRTIVFAPYFFLGIMFQQISFLDIIIEKFSLWKSAMIWMIVFVLSILFVFSSFDVRRTFGATYPYPLENTMLYAFARLLNYMTSVIISVAFIRVFSFESKILGVIGKDSLKYYMFHGIFLMVVKFAGLPWSANLAIVYALIVSIIIYYFNKTKLSDFSLAPVSVTLSWRKDKYEKS